MAGESAQAVERLLASLPDGMLGKLADLIALKLMEKDGRFMPSKQVVAGSSPVSRSRAIMTTCLTPRSVHSACPLPTLCPRPRLAHKPADSCGEAVEASPC